MYCRSCGSPVGEGKAFCSACGAPLQGTVQAVTPGPVKNKGVLPAPLYVTGLIFDIFNLLMGIAGFILGLFSTFISFAGRYSDPVPAGITSTVLSAGAAVLAFVAVMTGMTNRAKPKGPVPEDKTKSGRAFIILTCICIVVSMIAMYMLGTVMDAA